MSGKSSVILVVSCCCSWQFSSRSARVWMVVLSSFIVFLINLGSNLGTRPGQGHGGVFNHVFLATDHATSAHLHQDVTRRDAILFLGAFGKQQERAIDPGVTQRERIAVDADR